MKNSLQCPKCSGRRILWVKEVQDKAPGDGGGILSIRASVKDDGVALGEWENTGIFEAFVCAGCGFTEWFVRDPESLPIDGETVTLLEGNEASGPYR
jgi:predicted nucleic-acid-binding Zn-ribbon protein